MYYLGLTLVMLVFFSAAYAQESDLETSSTPSNTPKTHQNNPGFTLITTEDEYTEVLKKATIVAIFADTVHKSPEDFLELNDKTAKNATRFEGAKKAGKQLAKYDIHVGWVFCSGSLDVKICSREEAQSDMFYFRKEKGYTSIELTSLYDEDSIMANSLQLYLLLHMPILLDQDDLLARARKAQEEDKDLIVAYTEQLGTTYHRAFAELVFMKRGQYSFAMTAEKDVTKPLSGSRDTHKAQVWRLNCKRGLKDVTLEQCETILFRQKFTLAPLLRWLDVEDIPIMEVSATDLQPTFPRDIHQIRIFCTGELTFAAATLVGVFQKTLRNIVKFIVINVDDMPVIRQAQLGYRNEMTPLQVHLVLMNDEGGQYSIKEERDYGAVLGLVAEQLEEYAGIEPDADKYEYGATGELPQYVKRATEINSFEEVAHLVETQEDEFAMAVEKWGRISHSLDVSGLPHLSNANFSHFVESREALVVLFYMKWDARNKWTMWHMANISRPFAEGGKVSPFARVECFDWTDVCRQEGVTSFPSVWLYRRGQKPQRYMGFQDKIQLTTLAKTLPYKSPVELTSVDDVVGFMSGTVPAGMDGFAPRSVIATFPASASVADKQWFSDAYSTVFPHVLFATVSSDVAQQTKLASGVEVPAVALLRRTGAPGSTVPYTGDQRAPALVDFIRDSYLPSFPQLDAYNFPSLKARGLPFVLVVSAEHPSCSLIKAVHSIAEAGDMPAYVYAWMTPDTAVTDDILEDLTGGKVVALPEVLVVNHNTTKVYLLHNNEGLQPNADVTEQQVRDFLLKIQTGALTHNYHTRRREARQTMPFYNFVELVDKHGTGQNDDEDADEAGPDGRLQTHQKREEHGMEGEEGEMDLSPPSSQQQEHQSDMPRPPHTEL